MVAWEGGEKWWQVAGVKGGVKVGYHELVAEGGGVGLLTLKNRSTAAFLRSVVRILSRITSLSAMACASNWVLGL
jgi:hypothetical protein